MVRSERFVKIETSDTSSVLVNLAHIATIEEKRLEGAETNLLVYLADDTKHARYTIQGMSLKEFHDHTGDFCLLPPPSD